MTITIGSFSSNRLILPAQPFGYEGEPRQGLTARTFRLTGLLTPAEWSSLLSVYDTWRNTRITDDDTLLTKAVGTTVSVTISAANTVSVTGLACWFTEAPEGEQAGVYVNTTVRLVDAAQAVAVLLREQELAKQRQQAQDEDVDCALIAARLQRQKDETDCEIAALQGGLSNDFAVQELTKAELSAVSRQTAYVADTAAVEAIKAADLNVQLIERQAEAAAVPTYAQDLAAADLEIEAAQAQGRADAYAADTANLEVLRTAEIDVELLQYAAQVAAWSSGTRLDDLRDARALQAVYDKYIGEDLPDLGTITLGGATIKLLRPADTRSDGPQVALTAAGTSYITGPLTAHETRQIEGTLTSGSYASLLTWYDSTINAVPSAGTWFPTVAPTATAEPFLIEGAKATRYTVTVEVKKIR
jgi:hypothetical protein